MTVQFEKMLSQVVETHLPAFYKDEQSQFILFVKSYYEWLESTGQVIDQQLKLVDYRDVDNTIDDFVLFLKEKYLKNVPFATATNRRFLIKNATDIYRSKGTERCINLLLRLIHKEQSTVYHPSENILRPSAGEWVAPRYLELSPSKKTKYFLNKEIVGTTSNAYAFVERIVKKRVNGMFVEVVHISNVRGNFQYLERVVLRSDPTIEGAPKVLGSLTRLDIINGGRDFSIGDKFDIKSSSGKQGVAVVRELSIDSGKVDFSIYDGGFGYSSNAEVTISTKVLKVDAKTNANSVITNFQRHEGVTQPLRRIAYSTASNSAMFVNGTTVQNYHANGVVSSSAVVLNNNTYGYSVGSGVLIVKPTLGEINTDATFSIIGNTATALIDSYTNITATANVTGANDVSLGVHNVVNVFYDYPGNQIYGSSSNTYGTVSVVSRGTGAGFRIGTLNNPEILFLYTDRLKDKNTGNVAFLSIKLDGSNSNVAANGYGFPKYPAGRYTSTLKNVLNSFSGTIGTISTLSFKNTGYDYNANPFVIVDEPLISGYGYKDLTLKIASPTGLFVSGEVIEQSTNTIAKTITVDTTHGVAANGVTMSEFEIGEFVYQTNGTSNVATGYVYSTGLVGGNGSVKLINTTGTFNTAYDLHGLTSNATANVSNIATDTVESVAKGIVKSGNATSLSVKRITFNSSFTANGTIVGLHTGATATLDEVVEDQNTLPIGLNAVITANVQTGNAVASVVEVVDSGFGYVHGSDVTLVNPNREYTITARVNLINEGISQGHYKGKSDSLSGNDKLHDNDYYQEYSYEVQCGVPIEQYADALKHITHVAGTKMFGKVIRQTVLDSTIDVKERPRFVDLGVISNSNGKFTVGEVVYQSNNTANTATGTVVAPTTSLVTILDANVRFEVGQYVSAPNYASNTNSGIIQLVESNTTSNTLLLYVDSVEGAFDVGNTIESVTGRSLTILNVGQGNSTTGSFNVGENVYQHNGVSNTATGYVTFANNIIVRITNTHGTFVTNDKVYGGTSNAYANVSVVGNVTNTIIVNTAINTIKVRHTSGDFVGGIVLGSTSSATANVSSIKVY